MPNEQTAYLANARWTSGVCIEDGWHDSRFGWASPGVSLHRARTGECWRSWSPVLAVAYLATADYGKSWGEAANSAYAKPSLQAYFGSHEFLSHGSQVFHGPFYVMLWKLGSTAFKGLHPGWLGMDAGPFTNFLAFTLGVAAF